MSFCPSFLGEDPETLPSPNVTETRPDGRCSDEPPTRLQSQHARLIEAAHSQFGHGRSYESELEERVVLAYSRRFYFGRGKREIPVPRKGLGRGKGDVAVVEGGETEEDVATEDYYCEGY